MPRSSWDSNKITSAITRRGTKSLNGNGEGTCGEGFWWWPRRRGRSIPRVGCEGRANAGHRPEEPPPGGFSGKRPGDGVARRSQTTPGLLPPRALSPGRFPENRSLPSFRTGSMGKKRLACRRITGIRSADQGSLVHRTIHNAVTNPEKIGNRSVRVPTAKSTQPRDPRSALL